MPTSTSGRSMANVAVVGMGYWGKNLVRVFHELGALAAICDSSEAVEAICRSTYPELAFHRDYGAVLADSTIAAVALATPAASHYVMVRAALEAGKDVFVEKPLAIDLRGGEELVDLARSSGRILMVGHILRYHPAVAKLQQLIEAGVLGKIHCLYSNRLNIGKIRTEENILWSFAPHDISVILWLLDEMPNRIYCQGGAYLSRNVYDVTLSQFDFPSGVQAHIMVSWLHPFKEQRLVVVGSEKMAVFDDTAEDKLVLYAHRVEWKHRLPTAVKANPEIVAVERHEPLHLECKHFIDCLSARTQPATDGNEGLRVLKVLDSCQRALLNGNVIDTRETSTDAGARPFFVHDSAYVDNGAEVGAGTKIWHFSHVMRGARIGERCVIGQNVNIDGGTSIGNNVKIQNNVSVYSGVVAEDDVFLGPSCVLTNVSNPRSQVNRHSLYEKTLLRRGCTIGANATIVCGVTVGRYAFVAAGSVVAKDVPDYALMMGNPGRQVGWMSRHGHRLQRPDAEGVMRCLESGFRYREEPGGVLECLDLDEDAPLPGELRRSVASYRYWKERASS